MVIPLGVLMKTKAIFRASAFIAALFSISAVKEAVADGDAFIGFEAGMFSSRYQGELTLNTSGSRKPKKKATSTKIGSDSAVAEGNNYGLRLGRYINDGVRVYVSVNQSSGKANLDLVGKGRTDTAGLALSVDYLFMNGSPVRPFFGATIGAERTSITLSDMDGDNCSCQDVEGSKSALYAGAQMGLMAQIVNLDIEAGIKYRTGGVDISRGKHIKTEGKIHTSVIARIKQKEITQPYVSVSYRF